MRPTVQIGFDLSLAGAGDFLTLGDPVKGALDDSDYPLAGDILTDVSDDVRSVVVKRGRSSETTSVNAGAATVTLDNRTRLYDPTAAASVSPYGPSILPRKEIVITIGDAPLFTGQVEDWDLDYARSGDSVTLAKASDGFTLINQQTLASGAGASGISGDVIYQTASAIGWPMGRVALDTGTASVGAHTISDNQNPLPYMQKIVNTEQGLLFIGKDATLTFRDRISPRVDFGTRFTDDGTGIPFENIQITYGSEFLYTQIEVKYPAGEVISTSGSAAVLNYGVSEYSLDTFLPDASSASVIGEFLAEHYGQPTFRITGLDVKMDALTSAQQAEILGLDIGHGVRVVFTPNGVGDPIDRELAVDSIEHSIRPGSHTVSFKFFTPFLVHYTGSVTGLSGTAGTVIGVEGDYGIVTGSSSMSGLVTGAKGTSGSTGGSSGSTGTVTGIKTTQFTLDSSQLNGPDGLG